jgi:hypothetical protein
MTRKNLKRNVGPWILPSGSPSNSSKFVNCMAFGLLSG